MNIYKPLVCQIYSNVLKDVCHRVLLYAPVEQFGNLKYLLISIQIIAVFAVLHEMNVEKN